MIPFVIFLAAGTAVAMVAHLLRSSTRKRGFGPAGAPGGPLPSLVVAVGGAMFGGYASTVTQVRSLTDPTPYVIALLGAVVAVAIYHLFADRHHARRVRGRTRRARDAQPFIPRTNPRSNP